jgi:hypothetical protein
MDKNNRKISGFGDEVLIEPEKIVEVKPPKKSCSSCKQKGLNYKQWVLVSLGFYILFSSIYGTIELIKLLF